MRFTVSPGYDDSFLISNRLHQKSKIGSPHWDSVIFLIKFYCMIVNIIADAH